MTRQAFIKVANAQGETLDNTIYLTKDPEYSNSINDTPGDLYLEVPVESATYNNGELYSIGNTVDLYTKSGFSEPYISYSGEIVSTDLDYASGLLNIIVRHPSYRMKKLIATSDSDDIYTQTAYTGYTTFSLTSPDILIFKITTDAGATFMNGFEVGFEYSFGFGTMTSTLNLYPTLADAKAQTNLTGNLCTAKTGPSGNTSPTDVSFPIENAVAVSPSTDYYVRLDLSYTNSLWSFALRKSSGTSFFSYYSSSGWSDLSIVPRVRAYYTNEVTQFTVNGENVKDRVEATLTKYNELSSKPIIFNDTTLQTLTETSTYTHTNATIYDVIRKTVETGGNDDVFWYIDPATNVFWLLKTSTTPSLYLNTDSIIGLSYKIDATEQTNRVYVIGKDSGSNNYYSKHDDIGSQENYGIKTESLVDKRVTSSTTATAMANYIFSKKSEPVERITVRISENDLQDIDSIEMFDMVHLIKVQGSGRVYLDIDELDDIYADVDPYRLYDRVMRVASINHKFRYIELGLIQPSTMTDAMARQQKQITSLAVENNPTTPS